MITYLPRSVFLLSASVFKQYPNDAWSPGQSERGFSGLAVSLALGLPGWRRRRMIFLLSHHDCLLPKIKRGTRYLRSSHCHPQTELFGGVRKDIRTDWLPFVRKVSLTWSVRRFLFVGYKTLPPQLKSGSDGGKVASSHVVHLSCPTPDAVIYYTTDGMAPHLHSTNIKVFLFAFKSLTIRKRI